MSLKRYFQPAIAALITLTGCDSTDFDLSPVMVSDTVLVAAPIAGNEALPTALDVSTDGAGGIWGGRFPERSVDALQWDFAVRIRDGQVALVPQGALGVQSGAALTPALVGETLEGLREAPGQTTFIATEAVTMETGRVYAARTRNALPVFGSGCTQFSKISPLEIDQSAGRVRIAVTTNQRCNDPRLVTE